MSTHLLPEITAPRCTCAERFAQALASFAQIKLTAKRQHLRQALGAFVVALGCIAPQSQAEVAAGSVHTSRAPEVFDWNIFASQLVGSNLPPIQTHTLAIVQIAVHDALNAIDRRYEPYAHAGSVAKGALPAAVATATRDALVRMLPETATQVEARYAAKLAEVPDGVEKNAGIAAGRAAAAAIFARRGGEDLAAALGKPYTAGPLEPGVYQPTPPFNTVLLAGWSELAPFALSTSAQLRSRAPLSVASNRYARDYAEVKELGSARSTQRSATQTETARFWFDVIAKEWHATARKALADASADEWQAARTLALMSIAMADGVIASAETKFHFNYWRPITAIRAGDRDGNNRTQGDPAWEPLCATPPFPEHNSTHAVTGAAAAKMLALILGDRHTFTIDSPFGVSRTYHRFSTAAAEQGISRIFCGIHFRSGMDAGLAQGRRVAHSVFATLLRPVGHGVTCAASDDDED